MEISRRSFLRVAGSIGVSAMIPGALAKVAMAQKEHEENIKLGTGIGFPIPKAALADPLALITRLQWQQNIGSKFSFSQRGVVVAEMTLWAVNNENPSFVPDKPTSTRECFSLVFSGPPEPDFGQATFNVAHPKLGKFMLLVVPGISSGYYRHYEAIINRVFP
jgi:hypothetical protein